MATITTFIKIILEGGDLTFQQSKELLDTVFTGEVPEVQIAAFLAAMRMKTATPTEFAGLATSLKNHAVPVRPNVNHLVDTCGTGGAKVKTFNVSTASAFVAAAAGVKIAKHGNRGITSKCGSADVLAELGVKIDASPATIEKCIELAGIGFMFAPMFHPAMKFVQPIRKSLDFQTAFNILGPLANPANAKAQVMGVADESLLERIAETLKILGSKHAMVVHCAGLDEIGTFGKTRVCRLKDDNIQFFELDPTQFGIKLTDHKELFGGDAANNAKVIKNILRGKEKGPRKDIVLLNAAAAIIVGEKADDFQNALAIAEEALNSGNAEDCLDKLVEISNS